MCTGLHSQPQSGCRSPQHVPNLRLLLQKPETDDMLCFFYKRSRTTRSAYDMWPGEQQKGQVFMEQLVQFQQVLPALAVYRPREVESATVQPRTLAATQAAKRASKQAVLSATASLQSPSKSCGRASSGPKRFIALNR